jgi:Family of unknown function (DUF6298)
MMTLPFCVFLVSPVRGETLGPLKVHPTNPRYFSDGSGRAIYLTGSHTWLNFQDGGTTEKPRIFDYDAFLDFLEQHNHNFFRLWVWESTSWVWDKPELYTNISPMQYQRTGPGVANDGRPKYDLMKFNPEFFNRLRERVVKANQRGIYVGVKFFEGYSVAAKSQRMLKRGNPFLDHPFHKNNNVNGINGDLNDDGQGYETQTLANPEVTRLQDAYVRKVIDTVNDLDNVVFEISNESHGGSTAWQYHWIRRVHDYEKTKPKRHLVWMSSQWDAFNLGLNKVQFESPAEIVGPTDHDGKEYRSDPPIADGKKIVILDTDHVHPRNRKRISWVWKTFTRGMHTMLMDDPFMDVKRDEEMVGAEGTRLAMGDTLRYAKKIDLASMQPTDDLADCSTGYCLRNSGHEYLAYQSKSGAFQIQLTSGAYRYEWFNPLDHQVVERGTMRAETGSHDFTSPFDGVAVLYLKNTKDLASVHASPTTDSHSSIFPLTQEELEDESTLNEMILSDLLIAGTKDAPQNLREVRVRFFSHNWKDGPWHGTVQVVIPEVIAPDRRGLVAMCPPCGDEKTREGLGMRRAFVEETARLLGIPVVFIPNMGEHFGAGKIHPVSDQLLLKFIETEDPSWLPSFPCSAVRGRALTMVGKLTGYPTTKAVHLGSSISAHHAWVWPLFDDRVKGLVATGSIGFSEDKHPTDGSFKMSSRPALEAIYNADPGVRKVIAEHTDPYHFGDRLRCSVLQIIGSKDFASPPSTLAKTLPKFGGPTHLIFVPNYAHGWKTLRHLAGFRMWIEHVFFERPLSKIRISNANYTKGRVTVTARVEGRPKTQNVQFVYATTSERNFLRSRFFKDTPKKNYSRAKWESVRMTDNNNAWTATFSLPDPSPRFVAGFVDMEDEIDQTTGYVSSQMLWLTAQE